MTTTVGLPAETKDRERRVALTPSAVASLVHAGHRVLVQTAAGDTSSMKAETFAAMAARSIST